MYNMEDRLKALLYEAVSADGGHIFKENYEDGREYEISLIEVVQDIMKELIDEVYDEIDSWVLNKKWLLALSKALKCLANNDFLCVLKEYFKINCDHAEYAGLAVASLVNENKIKEAIELLELIKSASGGKFGWST